MVTHLATMLRRWVTTLPAALVLLPGEAPADDDFRVLPYLQNPSTTAMTLLWFSEEEIPGRLTFRPVSSSSSSPRVVVSVPERAVSLAYLAWEEEAFFSGPAPAPPYRHRVRLEGLDAGASYSYTVEQGSSRFSSRFTTVPAADQPVRLIFFADCETEPESTGSHVEWRDPTGRDPGRTYLLDQTDGFAANLKVVAQRQPDLVAIAGDLVESGGEQRDWDEFWLHLTRPDSGIGLASRVPVIAAPGNHEYNESPKTEGYNQPGSERAMRRYLTYFEYPSNGSGSGQEGRYYSLDYGPVTIVALDVANDSPHQSERDTNFFLLGEGDPNGGRAPAFGPGSRQYEWLRNALERAQSRSEFTFVIFHHVPYSVGPHGWPPGEGDGADTQSGVPVRSLTPLFLRYGVDAIIAGHDELWERSEIDGVEILPGGGERAHTLHVYDVGIAGDGLRGPEGGLTNPQQKFLVHTDAPEQWRNGVLVEGGKHYGHLEVDVYPLEDGGWQAELRPVHVFPLFESPSRYVRSERRLYDDVQILTRRQ